MSTNDIARKYAPALEGLFDSSGDETPYRANSAKRQERSDYALGSNKRPCGPPRRYTSIIERLLIGDDDDDFDDEDLSLVNACSEDEDANTLKSLWRDLSQFTTLPDTKDELDIDLAEATQSEKPIVVSPLPKKTPTPTPKKVTIQEPIPTPSAVDVSEDLADFFQSQSATAKVEDLPPVPPPVSAPAATFKSARGRRPASAATNAAKVAATTTV